ncbi:helix-turn-helix domain-containing protein [Embleya sp. NPDC056575]|uniref:helix-turn-helix domain-containing protein n=1 Tax=unclassified Embleya TaxID=2699296 RepID=UPI003675943A
MPIEQNPTVRRRRLGSELRRLREREARTLEDAAAVLECHKTKISRIENGRSGVRARDVRELLNLYGVDDPDVRATLEALAREGAKRGWWQDYTDTLPSSYADVIELEAAASYIRGFQTLLVPGLFQTEEYARAVHSANPAAIDPARTETLLEVRMARQGVLEKVDPVVRVSAIICEPAIITPVGGPLVMQAQLGRLLELSARPNVDIQILPISVGAHAGMSGPFIIFGFPLVGDTDVVFLENLTSSLYVEKQAETDFYTLVYDKLRSSALDPEASETAIRKAIAKLQ